MTTSECANGVGARTTAAIVVSAVVLARVLAAAGPEPGITALGRLKAGNARFAVSPADPLPPFDVKRAGAQAPFATVLSCADSRVPPEIIFRAGLGELFVVRAAGHVTDRAVLGSLEQGVEQLQTPLLVVMGHEMCGAVKAAMDTPAATSLGPNVDYLLKAIRPAVARAATAPADIRLRAAILNHVEDTINQLLETSAVIRRRAEGQQLTIAGAYYELSTGRVHFSEPVHVPVRTSAAPQTAPAAATNPAGQARPKAIAPTPPGAAARSAAKAPVPVPAGAAASSSPKPVPPAPVAAAATKTH